jgi:exopolysaccharide biosynthesis polyprenyl glycosylphosphotransferase
MEAHQFTQDTVAGHRPRRFEPSPKGVEATLALARGAAATAAADRRLRRGRTWFMVGADIPAVAGALALTYAAGNLTAPPAVSGPAWLLVLLAFVAPPLWVGIFTAYKLYERESTSLNLGAFEELTNLFHALVTVSLVMLLGNEAVDSLFAAEIFSAAEAVLFIAVAMPLVLSMRSVARHHVIPAVMRPRRVVIVGAGRVGRDVAAKLSKRHHGLDVVGFVDEEAAAGGDGDVLGGPSHLAELVDALDIDWVVLAFSRMSAEEMISLLRDVRRPDTHVSIVPRYYELFASNARLEDLHGIPVLSLPPVRMSRSVCMLKRAVDLSAAVFGLLLLAPVFAVVALAIKLESRGPVFFRQPRYGKGGREFRIVKFRTMVDGAEAQRHTLAELNEVSGPLFKVKQDPRITRVGGFLRRTSLDELPQLWNVLRGEMSLVGPRPFVVHEAEQITGWAGRRVDLTPGITGLWQVMGRNDVPFDEMVKLDYVYVTNWSLWWDFKILLQTIPTVLAQRGAY